MDWKAIGSALVALGGLAAAFGGFSQGQSARQETEACVQSMRVVKDMCSEFLEHADAVDAVPPQSMVDSIAALPEEEEYPWAGDVQGFVAEAGEALGYAE